MSLTFDQIPEQLRPRVKRAVADKLAAGVTSQLLEKQRSLIKRVIRDSHVRSGCLPDWITDGDILAAYDRLVKRMQKKGGVK